MGTASREAIIIMVEEEKRSPANLAYCLSCLSICTLTGWLCGIATYIMAFKAEESEEKGDSRRFQFFNSLGVILGILGIFFGLGFVSLFYHYIFPVWYRYLYLMVEPEYKFE